MRRPSASLWLQRWPAIVWLAVGLASLPRSVMSFDGAVTPSRSKAARKSQPRGGSGGAAATTPTLSTLAPQPISQSAPLDEDGLAPRLDLRKLKTSPPKTRKERIREESQHSGYLGVTWSRSRNKWMAQLSVAGRVVFMGYHASEWAAAGTVDAQLRQQGLAEQRGLNFPTRAEMVSGIHSAWRGPKATSRFVGVSFHKRFNKWQAQICLDNNTSHHLGYFETEEGAASAYDERAAPLGRPLNFPTEASVAGATAL